MRFLLTSLLAVTGFAQTKLEYVAAPANNPLKGLVPYITADAIDRFPHSLEFQYFALKDLMKGYDEFDWAVLEEKLAITQGRGCQLVMRISIESPDSGNRVPEFLVNDGVKVTEWFVKRDDGGTSYTPDYNDPKMHRALRNLITAFGKKYDGDSRIGYITAGLLGSWGEWHTYPRDDLWASKEIQVVVLNAYEKSFKQTPVLHRYPAGADHWDQAENGSRRMGYHDDSFAWATLESGKKEDHWFFIPLLKKAAALEKWKTQPIGGELRPELWKTSFTDASHEKAQDFSECVKQTHVSWLMDSSLFQKQFELPESRKQNAIREVQKMGYEFYISQWKIDGGKIEITVENLGVAPFYRDWPVELVAGENEIATFDLRGILPGQSKVWTAETDSKGPFKLRVKNPMEGGKPLRFANKEQGAEWLILP
ncbi:MAG: DUF4832 domain-containing protein [Verrucomicrobiales bacterium]